MLSKEEIETCKEELLNYIEFMESAGDNAGWARGLKWYIEQLETSNMTATKCVSIQQNAYWQGYTERDKKAQQICKECKYRKKLKQLETDKQKLIEKLKEDIEKATQIIEDKEYRYIQEVIDEAYERLKYAKEILKTLKGENDEQLLFNSKSI